MIQVHKKTQTIERLVEASLPVYLELLDYVPEKTKLRQVQANYWTRFILDSGLKAKSLGVFLPRSQTATIISGDAFGLFHEYFGHGLFCEQSILGRNLVNLESKLLSQEKQEYSGKPFCDSDLNGFRANNNTFNEIQRLTYIHLDEYESFALWSEYFLSEKHNILDGFERRYSLLSPREKSKVDNIVGFSKRYGELAAFYAQGMAKRINPERVTKLLQEVYRDKLNKVKFALVYGSRKEFSDIDILMVSDDAPEIDSWLDVTVYSKESFEQKINFFDIAVTNPLITGDFLFGDRRYFERCRERALYSPITAKAVKHNFDESVIQERLAKTFPEGSKENIKGLRYSLSYLASALALRNGLRLFDLDTLFSYLHKQIPKDVGKVYSYKEV